MCVLGCYKLFHDGGFYHIETSPLTCKANQWTGFYMIGTSVMKELLLLRNNILHIITKLMSRTLINTKLINLISKLINL